MMRRYMGLQILGSFLTSYVLVFSGEVWRPSVWAAGADQPSYFYGFFNGFWIWLGFFVPMLLGAVAWENRPWKLFGTDRKSTRLNSSHQIISYAVFCLKKKKKFVKLYLLE